MSLFLEIAIALPKDCHHESDTTFDLLFLRGGIDGDALTEGGRCNDLIFVAVVGGGFFYVLKQNL